MSPAHEGGPGTPWYARTSTLVLGAGALASAGLAVFALWDRIVPPDHADVASIVLVEISRRATLNQFAAASAGPDITLGPADDAAGSGTALLAPAWDVVAAVTPGPAIREPADAGPLDPGPGTTAPADPGHGTPTTSPAPVPTPSGTPSPGPTPAPTPAPTVAGTGSPTPSSGPTAIPTPATPGEGSVRPLRLLVPTPDVVRQVLADPALDDWDLEPEAVYLTTTEPVDPEEENGDALEPEELAGRLAEALSSVEVVDDGVGREPVGWVVSVGVTAQGLAGVPLLLTWSLDGIDVPQSWTAPNVAYRLTATTPDDAGNVEVWVPDLEGDSPYHANVVLSYERDGVVAARRAVAVPTP